VKDIPAIDDIPEVRVHEVTASGIDQWWNFDVPNPNRLKLRETDSGSECVFPFTYNGVEYNDCTTAGHHQEWCYTDASASSWGNCNAYNDIYTNIIASKERVCTNSAVHVCNAQANFGGISVDWEESAVTLSILTPHETSPVAASVTFPLDSASNPKPTLDPTPAFTAATVAVSEESYSAGGSVTIDYLNPAGLHIWLGVFAADEDPNNLPSSEDWAWPCGSKNCQEQWLTAGTIYLNEIGVGSWKAFIIADMTRPYEALAWSETFVVEPASVGMVSVLKSSYSVGETIVASFENPLGYNIWLGVYSDNSDPNKLLRSEDWRWPCDSQTCTDHSLTMGTVNFSNVRKGSWRVYLIKEMSWPYKSLSYSDVFVVTD
jgi:hypothetical protein